MCRVGLASGIELVFAEYIKCSGGCVAGFHAKLKVLGRFNYLIVVNAMD